jgi:hypothetical protein
VDDIRDRDPENEIGARWERLLVGACVFVLVFSFWIYLLFGVVFPWLR